MVLNGLQGGAPSELGGAKDFGIHIVFGSPRLTSRLDDVLCHQAAQPGAGAIIALDLEKPGKFQRGEAAMLGDQAKGDSLPLIEGELIVHSGHEVDQFGTDDSALNTDNDTILILPD
jgi:hypothetical protein